MSNTVQIDGQQLIALLRHSMKAGTQDKAIDLAITWVGAAEAEIGRLRACIAEMQAITAKLESIADELVQAQNQLHGIRYARTAKRTIQDCERELRALTVAHEAAEAAREKS